VTLGRLISQTSKAFVLRSLKRTGLYYRVKASRVHSLYLEFVDKSRMERSRNELDFYRKLLRGFRKGSLIFDIGANEGTKTSLFLRLGAKVIAVEPDVANQMILRQKYLKYRLVRKSVVVVSKAVSDQNGFEPMWIDKPGSALNTLSMKWVETLRSDEKRFGRTFDFGGRLQVETVTLEELMDRFGLPFFIKIDVEGAELRVLRGMRRPVPYLSFEVNLPEFLQEGMECVQILSSLVANGKFNYVVDCQQGLVLERWLSAREFSHVLTQCRDRSIEVIWKTYKEEAIIGV